MSYLKRVRWSVRSFRRLNRKRGRPAAGQHDTGTGSERASDNNAASPENSVTRETDAVQEIDAATADHADQADGASEPLRSRRRRDEVRVND
jgi:hypothetical protein